jgi:hypothetical protein
MRTVASGFVSVCLEPVKTEGPLASPALLLVGLEVLSCKEKEEKKTIF